MTDNIVIVGGGQAAGCAVAALRQSGYAGKLVLVGDEDHPPYERPPLSKDLLSGSIALERTYLQPADWYANADVTLLLNSRVERIDPHAKTIAISTGTTLPYDALLLATGARARQFRGLAPGPSVFYLRTIEESLALKAALQPEKRVAVIGAGFIGLEVAATARKQGCEVVVFEAANHVLARVAPEVVGNHVQRLHEQQGVSFMLGCGVAQAEAGTPCVIALTDGRRFEFDLIVVGIGAQPNVELAAEAGLAVDDGIVVDEFGRTSDPSIFAAGDVTKHFNPLLQRRVRLEAWQNAQNQAIAVAKVMAGHAEAYAEIPWLWSDQYDMNMQIAGMPANWDSVVFRGDLDTKSFTVFQIAEGKAVGAFSINAPKDMRFARRLLAKPGAIDIAALGDSKISLQDLSR